jgi:4-hydroxythreonine-4-phosphate dehydrogenase
MELSLKKDFLINKPKIAVLGLNPHAGDSGLLGKEENEIISPVIMDLKSKGKLVFGPFPADGFFAAGLHNNYDGVLAMYHDQGLVAFKALAFETGVNYTAGLPFVRTSPDHGTAYAIAGKNQANENSFRQAMYLATDIIKNRTAQTVEK